MLVKLFFFLHFIPLDPDLRTQMNSDPHHWFIYFRSRTKQPGSNPFPFSIGSSAFAEGVKTERTSAEGENSSSEPFKDPDSVRVKVEGTPESTPTVTPLEPDHAIKVESDDPNQIKEGEVQSQGNTESNAEVINAGNDVKIPENEEKIPENEENIHDKEEHHSNEEESQANEETVGSPTSPRIFT